VRDMGISATSRGGDYEYGRLLGRCAVRSGRSSAKFHRFLLPPSSFIALTMEAVRTSETSVNFYECTRRIFILAAVRTADAIL
jgi:hypothetical protein